MINTAVMIIIHTSNTTTTRKIKTAIITIKKTMTNTKKSTRQKSTLQKSSWIVSGVFQFQWIQDSGIHREFSELRGKPSVTF